MAHGRHKGAVAVTFPSATPFPSEKLCKLQSYRYQTIMVWPRRRLSGHHGPSIRQHPSRRRTQGFVVMAAAALLLLYTVYFRPSLHRLRKSLPTHSRPPPSSSTQYSAGGGGGGDGGEGKEAAGPAQTLPTADLLSGSPPKWRDPQRDFEAEYEEILEAVPELRSTKRARLAFFIMAHGPTDVEMLKRSLPWLYSPHSFILVSPPV